MYSNKGVLKYGIIMIAIVVGIALCLFSRSGLLFALGFIVGVPALIYFGYKAFLSSRY